MQNHNESLLDLFVLLYKWKKHILGASLLTAVIVAGISLAMPNYYEASTQFYAASPDLAQPAPLGNTPSYLKIYGNDNDIDRLISIAKSNVVSTYLIEKFDLYNHFDIETNSDKAKSKLLLKFDKLFEITKTKYDAIKLSFEDKDPQFAADVANSAREKIDELARQMIKGSQSKLLTSYKTSVEAKQKEYNSIADSLTMARVKYNIFNTQSQGEAFGSSMVDLSGSIENYKARISYLQSQSDVAPDSINIYKSKLKGYQNQYKMLSKDIQSYNDGYPKILKFERELKDFGDQLNIDKERLKQLEAVYGAEINAIHIVETAEKPVIKSRPKRSYIVIGLSALAFMLTSLWVIVQDMLNKNEWRDKFKTA